MRWLVGCAATVLALGCQNNTIHLETQGGSGQADGGSGDGSTGGTVSMDVGDGGDDGAMTSSSGPVTTVGTTLPGTTTPPTLDVGVPPMPGTVPSGRYLLLVDTIIQPGLPFQWEVNVDAPTAIASGQSLSLNQGSTTDPRVPIGGIWDAPMSGDESNLTIDPPPLLIMGEADPITGSDVLTDFVLTGGGSNGFYCGDASGTVTMPIMADLMGSTWAMIQLQDGEPYPVDFPLGC